MQRGAAMLQKRCETILSQYRVEVGEFVLDMDAG